MPNNKTYKEETVINGTYGEVWIDDYYLASLVSFRAVVTMSYAQVVKPTDLWEYNKLVSLSGEGEVVTEKYSSLGFRVMHDKIKEGKTPVCKIVTKLDDPDALGAERIAVKNITFNELALADWAHAEAGKETLTFNFAGYDLIEKIG